MTKQAVAMVAIILVFSVSAFAGNNPRIDQALMETLAEKKALRAELRQHSSTAKSQVNSKYRAVEILEVGDELGGYTSSTGLAEETTHKAVQALE